MPERAFISDAPFMCERYSSLYSIQRTRNPRRIDYSKRKWGFALRSPISTSFIRGAIRYLDGRLAVRTSVHGVLVDVYGLGVLIQGDSGIGKSETAY